MLLERYELEITSPPCDPGTERWTAFVRFTDDLSPVLPYLNAAWPGAQFEPRVPALNWRLERWAVVVRPHEIALGSFLDRAEAEAALRRVIALINDVWEHRETIRPSRQARRRLTPLEVYRLLPGGPCGDCGEGSCFIFANKLIVGQVQVSACTPLFTAAHATKREALWLRLQEAGLVDQAP
ncbi:MAG: hypothetical protein GX605_01265 [Chloroflexi bacterium]|nr:hypothetical protein [Chloroflexota bacterium]